MPQVQEVVVPGARLAVEIHGSGALPVIMLHGLAGNRRDWDAVRKLLPPVIRSVHYDLRGCGASHALDDCSFRHADDLAALLAALDIEQCDLVGISLGGSIALNFALDQPQHVRRLVLVSPGITGWEWSDQWRAQWRTVVAAARAQGVDRARQLWYEHPLFASTRRLPAEAAQLRAALEAYSGEVWLGGAREVEALPDLDRLPFLQASTLLLTGADDVPDFRLIAQLIEAAAPDVRRVDFADAGHLLNFERSVEVAAAIARFIS